MGVFLTLILIVLKLFAFIGWHWLAVLAPLLAHAFEWAFVAIVRGIVANELRHFHAPRLFDPGPSTVDPATFIRMPWDRPGKGTS